MTGSGLLLKILRSRKSGNGDRARGRGRGSSPRGRGKVERSGTCPGSASAAPRSGPDIVVARSMTSPPARPQVSRSLLRPHRRPSVRWRRSGDPSPDTVQRSGRHGFPLDQPGPGRRPSLASEAVRPSAAGRFRSIDRRAARNPSREPRASAHAREVGPLLRVVLQGVQLLAAVARSDVVHPPGDQGLHRPLGGRLAALVREQLGLVRLHQQRLGRRGSLRRPGPRTGRASGRGTRRACSSPSRSTTVAGRSRRLTGSATTRPAGTAPGIDDHQRDLDELPVQAAPVEEQQVVAEVLAVVRGHDHQRVVEHPAPTAARRARRPAAGRDRRSRRRRGRWPSARRGRAAWSCRACSTAARPGGRARTTGGSRSPGPESSGTS